MYFVFSLLLLIPFYSTVDRQNAEYDFNLSLFAVTQFGSWYVVNFKKVPWVAENWLARKRLFWFRPLAARQAWGVCLVILEANGTGLGSWSCFLCSSGKVSLVFSFPWRAASCSSLPLASWSQAGPVTQNKVWNGKLSHSSSYSGMFQLSGSSGDSGLSVSLKEMRIFDWDCIELVNGFG